RPEGLRWRNTTGSSHSCRTETRQARSEASASVAPAFRPGSGDREHPIQRDLRPVLLRIRYDDPVVHLALDETFEHPQEVIRRHAEHRRAEAAELIERKHGAFLRDLACETVHEMDLGADGPGRVDGALPDGPDDVFGRSRIICRLDNVPWH